MAEWHYLTAVATGTSHERDNLPCQDSAECRAVLGADGDRILIAAISDGAGSAALSQEGSQLACEVFSTKAEGYLSEHTFESLNSDIVKGWLTDINQLISEKASAQEKRPRDYACTLLAAIVSSNRAFFLQIGDGAIVFNETDEAEWAYAVWPQHGEFANTTNFLTDENALEQLEIVDRPISVKELCLLTDGMESLALEYSTKTAFTPFFEGIFSSIRGVKHKGFNEKLSLSLKDFLASPKVCERTDDDKTLIIAKRIEATRKPKGA